MFSTLFWVPYISSFGSSGHGLGSDTSEGSESWKSSEFFQLMLRVKEYNSSIVTQTRTLSFEYLATGNKQSKSFIVILFHNLV